MLRCFLVSLALLCLCGCQSGTGPALEISNEQAQALNLSLTGGVAADASGSVYLTTPDGLQRYDPGQRQLENLLDRSVTDLRAVAVTSDDVVLVLRPQALCGVAAGYLIDIHTVPGEATALSCDRGFAYILARTPKGGRLIRYTLTGDKRGYLQPILTTEDHPQAICAVAGGCLIASGGTIAKVTDPAPASGHTPSQVSTAVLVVMQQPITSVVADRRNSIVYFSTADATYAWIEGQVLPIFPAGNRLAWSRDTLTICLAGQKRGQLIQIPAVSQHTRNLVRSLTPPTPQPAKQD